MFLTLEQEQRTSLQDVIDIPEMEPADLLFYKNKKFIDVVRPFQEFFLYKSFMLVAHGNILSYYDTERESWRCHYHFQNNDEDEDEDFLERMDTR